MKKLGLMFIVLLLFTSMVVSQTYTTPNTGVNWTLDDIAAASPSTITISGNEYTILENIVIAENDTVTIDTDSTVLIDADLLLTVFGSFMVTANEVTITALNENTPFSGFRFEEFSEINIQNTTISYSGGLKVLTEDFTINNSTLTQNVEGETTGGVISLSRGVPQITNNTITFNELPAVSSAANTSVSAYIFNNYIEGNNQSNSNRPQINMGTTRELDTLKIIQNTIIGDPTLDLVGGIAVANLVGGLIRVIIDDNEIRDHRYGLTVVGPESFAYIRDNIIEDNNTQNLPLQGGSGMSLNTSSGIMEVIASGNQIRRNLWGITVIGTASINLGDDDENIGGNVFAENGNGGDVFALYNNTSNTLQAKNNCWIEGQVNTSDDAEAVIFHQVDDAALGEVIFDPVETGCENLGISDINENDIILYPNPTSNFIQVLSPLSPSNISIYSIEGKQMADYKLLDSSNKLDLSLPSGIYFARIIIDGKKFIKKIIIQ